MFDANAFGIFYGSQIELIVVKDQLILKYLKRIDVFTSELNSNNILSIFNQIFHKYVFFPLLFLS